MPDEFTGPWKYTGNDTRTYVQYRDTGTWLTLVAEPGGEYGMVPAGGAEGVTVPPSDGRWDPPPVVPAAPERDQLTGEPVTVEEPAGAGGDTVFQAAGAAAGAAGGAGEPAGAARAKSRNTKAADAATKGE